MEDVTLLTQDLLADLKEHWRARDAAVARLLRPGLSESEMDRLTEPFGIRLPDEAKTWWGWHDGAEPPRPGLWPAELGPNRAFLPLRHATEQLAMLRSVGIGSSPDLQREAVAATMFLPIDGGQMPAVVDCEAAVGAPASVQAYVLDNPAAASKGVRSMGELVMLWIRAMETGLWIYDRERELWTGDYAKISDCEVGDLL